MTFLVIVLESADLLLVIVTTRALSVFPADRLSSVLANSAAKNI